MTRLLEPLEPCDCRRLTVLRQDGVPTCHRCQKAQRAVAQTWIGQEPVAFKMDEVVRLARQRLDVRDNASISCKDIIDAFNHDVALKHAMSSMRYEEYRRLHPHKTKEDLLHD